MFVKNEIYDFGSLEYDCWSGAIDTLNRIKEVGKEEEFMDYLEDIFCDEIPTMTELNDFIWFEDEMIYEDLGIYEEEDDEDEEDDWEDEEEEEEEDEEDEDNA